MYLMKRASGNALTLIASVFPPPKSYSRAVISNIINWLLIRFGYCSHGGVESMKRFLRSRVEMIVITTSKVQSALQFGWLKYCSNMLLSFRTDGTQGGESRDMH